MKENYHQLKQKENVDALEEQMRNNSIKSSVVLPVDDFEKDSRICLTSVHMPDKDFLSKLQESIVDPLRKIDPQHYYYHPDSMHMTIKNVRVINDPPNFSAEDVEKVKKVFSEIIPQHKRFNVYFYRLMLFPNNLALIATSDPELDNIIIDLDNTLNDAGVPDDKKYINSKYFFCNITLARFNSAPSEKFKQKVKELSDSLKVEPYNINSVTLLTANAALKKLTIIGKLNLKD